VTLGRQVWSPVTCRLPFFHPFRSRGGRIGGKKVGCRLRYYCTRLAHRAELRERCFLKAHPLINEGSRPYYLFKVGPMTRPKYFEHIFSICAILLGQTSLARGFFAPFALGVEYSTTEANKYQPTTSDRKRKQRHLPLTWSHFSRDEGPLSNLLRRQVEGQVPHPDEDRGPRLLGTGAWPGPLLPQVWAEKRKEKYEKQE